MLRRVSWNSKKKPFSQWRSFATGWGKSSSRFLASNLQFPDCESIGRWDGERLLDDREILLPDRDYRCDVGQALLSDGYDGFGRRDNCLRD